MSTITQRPTAIATPKAGAEQFVKCFLVPVVDALFTKSNRTHRTTNTMDFGTQIGRLLAVVAHLSTITCFVGHTNGTYRGI